MYRTADGYPTGVVPDIYMMFKIAEEVNEKAHLRTPHDPVTMSIKYIVYNKLTALYRHVKTCKTIENILAWLSIFEYIVQSDDVDVEYKYIVDLDKKTIKIIDRWEGREEELTIDKAYEKYGKEYPNGCHIIPEYIRKVVDVLLKHL